MSKRILSTLVLVLAIGAAARGITKSRPVRANLNPQPEPPG